MITYFNFEKESHEFIFALLLNIGKITLLKIHLLGAMGVDVHWIFEVLLRRILLLLEKY